MEWFAEVYIVPDVESRLSRSRTLKGFMKSCKICGSALFWQADGTDEISIMAGLFEQPSDLKLAYHIYCADKGDFYEISDGLPQHRQGHPGLLTAGPSD